MSATWSGPAHDVDVEQLRRHNQRDRVKEILRSANTEGVCTFQWNALGLVNARNRIGELRDPKGEHKLDIESVPCDPERYHAEELREARGRGQGVAPHTRYVWHWNPAPRQIELLRAE